MANGDLWRGTTHGAVFRGNNLVSVEYRSRGSFWFTADEGGRVEGHALIVYEPTFGAGGINAALGHIKSAGSAALGTIPILGPTLSTLGGVLTDAIAVRGEFDEPMTAVEGPITGTLTEDGLDIAWADVDQPELPLTVFLDKVGESEEITTSALGTESPWAEGASVEVRAGVRHATSVHRESSTNEGVTVTVNNAWSAVGSSSMMQSG